MSNSIARVNYDELTQISKQLHTESEDYTSLHSQTRQKMDALRSQWQGDAAQSFFGEMDGSLLPAVQRVSGALLSSQSVLEQIMKITHEADEEAASYFKRLGADGGSSLTLAGGPGAHSILPSVTWLTGGLSPADSMHADDAKLKVFEGAVAKTDHYKLGAWEAGVKAEVKDGEINAGVYAEGSVAEVQVHHTFGGSIFGVTTTGNAKLGTGEVLVGIKDNSFGASIGGSVASAEAGVGLNIAGANVGVTGEVKAGLEFGFKIGPDTKIAIGPFKIGLHFGKAITNEE